MNTAKFNNKLDKEMNKFKKIKSAFEKITKAESNLYDTRHKYFNNLKTIKETDNTELNDIYSIISSTMINLENKRKDLFILIDSKIIPSSVNFINSAKELKKGVSNYQSLKKENEKKEKERQKAASNNEKEKDKLIQQDIQSGQNQLNEEQSSTEDALVSYENDRIMNNKYLILHYIHSELAFHANAVEQLSKAYSLIFDKQPLSKLPDFVKDYNLNYTNDDLRMFGYDKKKFKKKSQKQENQNNRNFGMIQPIDNNSNINNDNSNIGGSNIGKNVRNFDNISIDSGNNKPRRRMVNDDEFGEGNMDIK
jgi:hypothetical protein